MLGTEGADCIVSPSQLGAWWEDGLRAVSLVHYGVSKYAHGTGTDGPLSADGRDLLAAMDEVGAILDVTHQSDTSFWESLERFRGPVFASHQNCRALVPGGRQMSDEQLKALIERDAVIGAALDNWMLYPGYVRRETPRELIHLSAFVDHIDYLCQLAGSARHAAIGIGPGRGLRHGADARWSWTPSPICSRCRRCCASEATRTRTCGPSWGATRCASSPAPCPSPEAGPRCSAPVLSAPRA